METAPLKEAKAPPRGKHPLWQIRHLIAGTIGGGFLGGVLAVWADLPGLRLFIPGAAIGMIIGAMCSSDDEHD